MKKITSLLLAGSLMMSAAPAFAEDAASGCDSYTGEEYTRCSREATRRAHHDGRLRRFSKISAMKDRLQARLLDRSGRTRLRRESLRSNQAAETREVAERRAELQEKRKALREKMAALRSGTEKRVSPAIERALIRRSLIQNRIQNHTVDTDSIKRRPQRLHRGHYRPARRHIDTSHKSRGVGVSKKLYYERMMDEVVEEEEVMEEEAEEEMTEE